MSVGNPRNRGVRPLDPDLGEVDDTLLEVPCKRCHETGQDRDGADCVFCDGYGSIISP